jgi:DDE superfamily endonuclease
VGSARQPGVPGSGVAVDCQPQRDSKRRRKAGAPEQVGFKTKPEIALEQLRWACEAGLPRRVALLDAGYGNNSELRANITELGLSYAAGSTGLFFGMRPPPRLQWIKLWGNVKGPRVPMVGGWHLSTFSGLENQKIDVHRHHSTYSGLGKMN